MINEAIEIAKRYGTEESGAFVNGILDRVSRGDACRVDGRKGGRVDGSMGRRKVLSRLTTPQPISLRGLREVIQEKAPSWRRHPARRRSTESAFGSRRAGACRGGGRRDRLASRRASIAADPFRTILGKAGRSPSWRRKAVPGSVGPRRGSGERAGFSGGTRTGRSRHSCGLRVPRVEDGGARTSRRVVGREDRAQAEERGGPGISGGVVPGPRLPPPEHACVNAVRVRSSEFGVKKTVTRL